MADFARCAPSFGSPQGYFLDSGHRGAILSVLEDPPSSLAALRGAIVRDVESRQP